MTDLATLDHYGALTEPTTLTIQRLLPGPVERIWAYLTDGELRRKWLAAGAMEMKAGAPFELVWRNDELSSKPSQRPTGFPTEHSMDSRITECEHGSRLSFTWRDSGDITFELEPRGEKVLLTVIHRRLPSRDMLLKVAAGWHAHLDTLVAAASGREPDPFWERWLQLKDDYDRRLP